MDDRPDSTTREEGAVFVPTRVRGARGARILASVVIVAVGALIALGALDRPTESSDVAVAPASEAPAATLRAQTAESSRPRPRASAPAHPGTHDAALDAVFAFDVRPAGSHLFIHGDVFSLAVTHVRVTLEDAAGHVADRVSVEVPGGSRAFLLGAVPRFDVHFFLPDEVQADG
ncbi:MAG TPA: hypothetical protein VN671_11620, partial [Solirubrobacterales bacterium]|nr:hypothetical protein [Solirubrobacterales bacterium]